VEVFGLGARADDFTPDTSGVDFLAEFVPGMAPDLRSSFSAKAALEKLLGRGLDW
jgi:hypothetical protein